MTFKRAELNMFVDNKEENILVQTGRYEVNGNDKINLKIPVSNPVFSHDLSLVSTI